MALWEGDESEAMVSWELMKGQLPNPFFPKFPKWYCYCGPGATRSLQGHVWCARTIPCPYPVSEWRERSRPHRPSTSISPSISTLLPPNTNTTMDGSAKINTNSQK